VIMSAGNLATTQCVIEQVRRDIREGNSSLNNNFLFGAFGGEGKEESNSSSV
jgi:predicted proteasome-type protease